MFRTLISAILSLLLLSGAKPGPPTDQELIEEAPASGQPPLCSIKPKQVSLPIYDRPYGKRVSELRQGVKVRAFYNREFSGRMWSHIALDHHPWGLTGYVLRASLACGGPPSKAYDAYETCIVRTFPGNPLRVYSEGMEATNALIRSGDRVLLQPDAGREPITRDGQEYVWIERTINDNPLGYVPTDRLDCREDE